MPPDGPSFLIALKDNVDRLIKLIDEFAKEKIEDLQHESKYKIEVEKRFGAIDTALAVSKVRILIYGGIGGVVGSSIVGAVVWKFFSE